MKKIMLAVAAAIALAAPAQAEERRYSVTDFDRVVVEGPYSVRLVAGRPSSAVATGRRQALDGVSVDVIGRTLRVRPNRSGWGGYPGESGGPVALELSTRDLRAVTLAGSGRLALDGARGLRLDISLEGSGRVSATNIAADNLTLGLLGSGRIDIAGTAEQLRASVHGTGDLDGTRLRAEGANITTDTAGRVVLTVSNNATVTASGLGEVEIIGSPACTVRGLSAGQVRCGR